MDVMLNQNEMKFASIPSHRKMPLDVRIVAWLLVISAFMHFFITLLLLIGIAHSPSDYNRPVLFGTLSLGSDLSSGIYSSLLGGASLVSAYSLVRGHKFGWWFVLIFSIYNIYDALLLLSCYPTGATIGICISFGIIGWLVYRRRLYNIGRTEES